MNFSNSISIQNGDIIGINYGTNEAPYVVAGIAGMPNPGDKSNKGNIFIRDEETGQKIAVITMTSPSELSRLVLNPVNLEKPFAQPTRILNNVAIAWTGSN
tara:strand:- start:126 stop:428 length:303 start_codon:yes stop_codon:yes gene_type:complete